MADPKTSNPAESEENKDQSEVQEGSESKNTAPDAANDNAEAKGESVEEISDETKDETEKVIRPDYSGAGKTIGKHVKKGKEVIEATGAQEKLNKAVIAIKTNHQKKLDFIENKLGWKRLPLVAQKYIVLGGPFAGFSAAAIFPPAVVPSAAVTFATSFLVKTGLLSYKGEITDGKIDLQKSVSIGKGTDKIIELTVKGLQMLFEELEGMEKIIKPGVEGLQLGDKVCAIAKENLYRHLAEEEKKKGKKPLEIKSSNLVEGKKKRRKAA